MKYFLPIITSLKEIIVRDERILYCVSFLKQRRARFNPIAFLMNDLEKTAKNSKQVRPHTKKISSQGAIFFQTSSRF